MTGRMPVFITGSRIGEVEGSLICKYWERAQCILPAYREGAVFGDAHYRGGVCDLVYYPAACRPKGHGGSSAAAFRRSRGFYRYILIPPPSDSSSRNRVPCHSGATPISLEKVTKRKNTFC